MSVIYIGMKDQSVSVEASLEVSAVCTFHALLNQNLYGKGRSSEVLVVYRHILDIMPSGFSTGRSQECVLWVTNPLWLWSFSSCPLQKKKKEFLKVKHAEISAGSYAALATYYYLGRLVPFKSIAIFKELVT